ncbi:hypothetical protein LY76DRAFT_590815 [Colletotrichum caudatum]|nr:hypothetical protein LY76DRAFT_590815 [Colletotrichum caudatum]
MPRRPTTAFAMLVVLWRGSPREQKEKKKMSLPPLSTKNTHKKLKLSLISISRRTLPLFPAQWASFQSSLSGPACCSAYREDSASRF